MEMKKLIFAVTLGAMSSLSLAAQIPHDGLGVRIAGADVFGKAILSAKNVGSTEAVVSLALYKLNSISDPDNPAARIKRDGKNYALYWVNPQYRLAGHSQIEALVDAAPGDYLLVSSTMGVPEKIGATLSMIKQETRFKVSGQPNHIDP